MACSKLKKFYVDDDRLLTTCDVINARVYEWTRVGVCVCARGYASAGVCVRECVFFGLLMYKLACVCVRVGVQVCTCVRILRCVFVCKFASACIEMWN